MALIAEDGTGVLNADTYASLATILAYWEKRAHDDLQAQWIEGSEAEREGAAREATAWLDAVFGRFYLGHRRGYVQGLQWPRLGAVDALGFDLPNLPQCLIDACCELAARALVERLSEDADVDGVRSEEMIKVGPITESVSYARVRRQERYGYVVEMLGPILNGNQTPAAASHWNWR